MTAIKRMLVPTDFSPTSEIAFVYALDMAAREGSTLHLLHVVDEASFATAYPDGFYVELPGVRAQLHDEANARLQDLVARCTAANVTATTELAVGRAAAVIVQSATTLGTDLIVIGTHGRSGFAHLMLGSVTERVVRMAPCAVLTVRDTSRIADTIAAETVARRSAAVPA